MAYSPKKTITSKPYDHQWDQWSIRGDFGIVGHSIVEGTRGHRLDNLESFRYMIVQRPHGTLYHHSYGLISRFFQGLVEKKLLGTRCPRCGFTFCPPRAHCWTAKCRLRETEWIELPMHGTVVTFTPMGFAATPFLKTLPFILVYVRVDGANTALPLRLYEVKPEEVNAGLKVDLHFIDEPRGDLMDIYCTPAEKPVSPKRTPEEVARLREDMEIVKRWVKKKFG